MLTIYPVFALASAYQDWGRLCERDESHPALLGISQHDSAELLYLQDQCGIIGRSANCCFICSFSSLRNLQRCVRLWRKEMWNGAAEVPLTKGRTHHPRHLLLHSTPACLSARLTSNNRAFALMMFCSPGHPVAGPNKTSLL